MVKTLPLAIPLTLLLFSGIFAAFQGLMQQRSESEDVQRYAVGIVGDSDSAYMNFGLSAISSFDETRFSIELLRFDDEDTALGQLRGKKIVCYFVFPDGFVEAALYGRIQTIRVVSMESAGNFVLLFKEEMANAATKILAESQKGVYGTAHALDENGYEELSSEILDRMSVEYFDLVFHRTDLFSLEELGVADRLSLPAYYFCSFAVFLLLLMGLPYASLFVKKDLSLHRMLCAARFSPLRQTACECAALFSVQALLFIPLLLLLGLLSRQEPALFSTLGVFELHSPLALAALLLPVLFMTAALSALLFELSGDLVSGILLHFFVTLSLCYISGCFYPLYAFPKVIQAVAPFLPTGAARAYFAALITGESPLLPLFLTLFYGTAFFAAAAAVRRKKLRTL